MATDHVADGNQVLRGLAPEPQTPLDVFVQTRAAAAIRLGPRPGAGASGIRG